MGRRSNGALLEETEKIREPFRVPRIAEQPRRHDSSVRYIHDPMTQGYRSGGGRRSYGTMRGSRLGAQDCSSLFLAIGFGPTDIPSKHLLRPMALGPARYRYRPWKVRVHVHSPW